MKDTILKELNKQLNNELCSAYLYLSMSAYLQSQNLSGFSNWMKVQFEEEQAHAMKIYQFIIDRGGKVELADIPSPIQKWTNVIDVFEHVVKHEGEVSETINNIMNISYKENDHATASMLQWFINEQVEEEANVSDVLSRLKMIDGKGTGLFIMDSEMKTRKFQPIAQQK